MPAACHACAAVGNRLGFPHGTVGHACIMGFPSMRVWCHRRGRRLPAQGSALLPLVDSLVHELSGWAMSQSYHASVSWHAWTCMSNIHSTLCAVPQDTIRALPAEAHYPSAPLSL